MTKEETPLEVLNRYLTKAGKRPLTKAPKKGTLRKVLGDVRIYPSLNRSWAICVHDNPKLGGTSFTMSRDPGAKTWYDMTLPGVILQWL